MKKIMLIFFCVIILSPGIPEAGISGKLMCRYISDSNVYDDNRRLADSGMDIGFLLNYMEKIGENIYPRFNFEYSSKGFPVYNLDNQNSTLINGSIRGILNEMFTAGVEVGSDMHELPNQSQYNTSLLYLMPFIKFYPYYFTEIEVGLMDNNVVYPNYDLDYGGNKGYFEFTQDMPLDVTLKLIGITGDRNYSERRLYDTSSTTYPVLSSEYRHDTELSYSVKLKRYMERIGELKIGYNYEKLDSNDNDFYWGPLQTEDNNTAGDEQVLSNFWDYELTKLSISLEFGTPERVLLEIYWHNRDKKYKGWIARDSSDSFLTPIQSRHDKQQVLSLVIEKEANRNTAINLGFSNTVNQSNDYPYDCDENVVDIGIKFYF